MERAGGYSIFEALWAAVSAAAARAAAARELRRLSDHQLRDIGLHRSQIESAVRGERRCS